MANRRNNGNGGLTALKVIGGIAAAGSVAALAGAAIGGNRSANVTLPNQIDAKEVAKIMQANPEAFLFLRGADGTPAPQPVVYNIQEGRNITFSTTNPTNDQGVDSEIRINKTNWNMYEKVAGLWGLIGNLKGGKGADGETIQNYSNSLLFNSGPDLQTNQFWGLAQYDAETESIFTPITNTYYYHSKKIKISDDNLLRVKLEYKGDPSVLFDCYSFKNVLINESGKIAAYTNGGNPLAIQNVFTKITLYFGGSGILVSNVNPNTFQLQLRIKGSSVVSYIRKVVIEKIQLGEPVPHNLPWLPTRQEVINETTGARGYWNGTAFKWYTMAV